MKDYFVHPTSIVADNAVIGEGTKIWVNCQIREDAVIGSHCILSKDTYIDHAVRIGSYVKIQNGVSIYSGVTIEDSAFIGPNVAFTNDRYPRAFNLDWKITETLVRTGASIGANATIRCGITIGEYAMIGAGSVVTKDIPAYSLWAGNPARQVGWVCKCGERLDENMYCQSCGLTQKIT